MRLAATLALVSLALLAAAQIACAPAAEPPAARHLLLVTLDTTRADRLGCYGHAGAGTPTIDALAAGGTRFLRAYAQTPLTLPSHVSILTGLNPPRTGIHVNGQRELLPGVRSLAEILSAEGFFTAAAVGGYPLSRRFPVSRGFESFDDRMNDSRNPSGLERDAGDVVGAAVGQLAPLDGRRLFLWVHFFDPHDPYTPHPPFDQRYAGDPYQGEIARVDAALAELLDALESRLGGERLLVCVVGDHGEGLGDHGEPTHGFFLYESTVRVPLILAGPRVPRGRTPRGPVRTVDLLPTLLSLLDLPVPQGLDGSVIDVGGDEPEQPEGVYLETELPLRNFGWSPLHGVVDGWRKYIAAPRAELYDLRNDPGESVNLVSDRPEEAADLAAWIAEEEAADAAAAPASIDPRLTSLGYVGSGAPAEPGGGLADPKDRLGTYVRFLTSNRLLEEGKPAEALPWLDELIAEDGTAGARFKRARALRMLGRLDEAEAELVRLEEEGTSFDVDVALERARIALWNERPELALEKLEVYLAAAPTDAEALMFRGAAREMLEDPTGAEEDYRRALAINPASHGASLRLGALLLVQGRTGEARSCLSAHLKRFPDDEIARGLLDSL